MRVVTGTTGPRRASPAYRSTARRLMYESGSPPYHSTQIAVSASPGRTIAARE
ncbi:hypothetical protein [Gordonia sp. (in: high G+C Gram-positive bacteria)]|uniref:hypothetical protein n=1 Tax=Gordonia sp. (in: high G+C Gram-positive bacteria) TaxID=84139 RepID=UPI0039E2DD29